MKTFAVIEIFYTLIMVMVTEVLDLLKLKSLH